MRNGSPIALANGLNGFEDEVRARAELLVPVVLGARVVGLGDRPSGRGDRRLQSRAVLIELRSKLQTDPKLDTEALERAAQDAIDALAADDDLLLARAWELLAWAPWLRGQVAQAETALRHAIHHARAGIPVTASQRRWR